MNDLLLIAIIGGDVGTVQAMLRSKPKLASAKYPKGHSAVLLATNFGKKDMIPILLKSHVDLNIFEGAAIATRRVRQLIEKDRKLTDAYAADGFFPFGIAMFFGHRETTFALMEAGVEVNIAPKESVKVMPLRSAIAAQQMETAGVLISRDANVNARSDGDFGPQHEAAPRSDLDLVTLRAEKGVDVNAKAKEGKTAPACATDAKKDQVVVFLRKHGAHA